MNRNRPRNNTDDETSRNNVRIAITILLRFNKVEGNMNMMKREVENMKHELGYSSKSQP